MKAQNIHLSIVTVGAYVTPGSAEARAIADLVSGSNTASHQRNGQRKRFIPPHTISNLPPAVDWRPGAIAGRVERHHPSLAFPVTSDQDTTIFMEAV
ncbi:hypothetical protein LNP25_24320 [Klebsiella variicola subsp. variicola]|nr:hypothetical protein [Klebsiella variicola subsp. variicola]